ncbi:MAG: hypothetical protein K1X86_04495 [Ignavibacteria bacterium]|nr:hypothetical protein [Ignavibacteria bacterium]
MERNAAYYSIKNRTSFFSSILSDIVKYEFNYKLSDNNIVIYSEGREIISYRQDNLRNDFLNYLVNDFSR